MMSTKREKYRLKAYNVSLDIYYIEKQFLWMWWSCGSFGAGKKEKMTQILEELIGISNLDKDAV